MVESATAQRYFFDTNIALYCFEAVATQKQFRAQQLITLGASTGQGVVSHQVLQEFCNVASHPKRLNLATEQILTFLQQFLRPMHKVSASEQLLENALQVRSSTGYSFYDSLIIAAAQEARCDVLYSEDMQHGQVVEGVRIVNPFVE